MVMADVDGIRERYQRPSEFLDERGSAVVCRDGSAVGRVLWCNGSGGGDRDCAEHDQPRHRRAEGGSFGERIRRAGGGRKRAVDHRPGLLAAFETLIEDAIRGDPEAPLRWVSRSQRNIAEALRRQGFEASAPAISVDMGLRMSERVRPERSMLDGVARRYRQHRIGSARYRSAVACRAGAEEAKRMAPFTVTLSSSVGAGAMSALCQEATNGPVPMRFATNPCPRLQKSIRSPPFRRWRRSEVARYD